QVGHFYFGAVGQFYFGANTLRSLPHRQLRKWSVGPQRQQLCSLPHRQLRNLWLARTTRLFLFTAA
ncbi:hypothetical protein ACFSHV_20180, partial [Paracidovorax cattleyae]|uniref:hypothetical protein n=1 Tax=Paracidovorax cattleyae TaxID=80868 RepID=UPI003628CBD3